jgi:hypothetical protein
MSGALNSNASCTAGGTCFNYAPGTPAPTTQASCAAAAYCTSPSCAPCNQSTCAVSPYCTDAIYFNTYGYSGHLCAFPFVV